MTPKEAIKWVDIARISYICDPKECGLEKGKFPCSKMNCDEIHDALSMAKEALEKQIPKKPIRGEYGHAECAVCGSILESFCGDLEKYPFCSECGQSLDWTEDNE